MKALIGHTGFVGTTLKRQVSFDALFRSTDISEIHGKEFDSVVCAGAPAQKWIAERDPDSDRRNIEVLAGHLDRIVTNYLVLISTVDVYADSRGVDERTPADESNSAYGRNRLWLEKFVARRFSNHLIVRLPGLVGPGLRKNVLFDFKNNNMVDRIDSRGIFQFYPMVNLWSDISIAAVSGIKLIHLTAAPVSASEVAQMGFGFTFDNVLEERAPASYDFRTAHAKLFGGEGDYTYSKRESLLAIRAFAQTD